MTENVPLQLTSFVPEYVRGVPTTATAQRMFDELAYQRAVQVYLWALPAVGMQHYRLANAQAMGGGPDDRKVGYLGGLLKSNIEHVTGNPDSNYIEIFVDTTAGPVVVEVPPELPGLIDDMWEKPVIDLIAPVSPTGKYLIVPPGWNGEEPDGYRIARPATFVSWVILRGGVDQTPNGPDTTASTESMKKNFKVYPYDPNGTLPEPRPLTFHNVSDLVINRIMPEGLDFFYTLAGLMAAEPNDQTDPFAMGLMRSIGIAPGVPFAPDERTQAILQKAAETGMAMARSIAFHGNETDRWHWTDRRYAEAFMGGSADFVTDGHVNHDARIYFFYFACGTSSLMASTTPGQGQAYPWAAKDADGNPFDGAETYRMHIPADIPAEQYWSVTAYDTITRSQVHNDTDFARISTYTKPVSNDDGSIDLYFGPTIPDGQEANWIRTIPGQGWFFLFRLYGPGASYFDRTWKPDDVERITAP
jgi:hypothetical protein